MIEYVLWVEYERPGFWLVCVEFHYPDDCPSISTRVDARCGLSMMEALVSGPVGVGPCSGYFATEAAANARIDKLTA